jgi:hypothetical protein
MYEYNLPPVLSLVLVSLVVELPELFGYRRENQSGGRLYTYRSMQLRGFVGCGHWAGARRIPFSGRQLAAQQVGVA